MVFSPGEYVHQSFKREFFDGLCGSCHGSISGRSIDSALNETTKAAVRASNVWARSPTP